jgi:hypothetical protein
MQRYQSATVPIEEVCTGKSMVTSNGLLSFKQCIRLNYTSMVQNCQTFHSTWLHLKHINTCQIYLGIYQRLQCKRDKILVTSVVGLSPDVI